MISKRKRTWFLLLLVLPATASLSESTTPPDEDALSLRPRPPVVLAGRELRVLVDGPAQAEIQWQLGKETVVAADNVRLDVDGRGVVRVEAPKVRQRARLTLVAIAPDESRASVEVVFYPARLLGRFLEPLKELEIGLIESDGALAEALRAEGVNVQPLETDLQRNAFNGDALLIGAPKNAEELTAICESFAERCRAGLDLVVINPPDGWSWSQVSAKQAELCGEPRADEGFRRIVNAADLGKGPWPVILTSSAEAESLLWIPPASPAESGTGNTSTDDPAPAGTAGEAKIKSTPQTVSALVLRKAMGEGRLYVATFAELDSAGESALGRTVLCEILATLPSAPTAEREGARARSQS
jgi:hypothetical protein